MSEPGYTAAQGYAASLRQHARWIRWSHDPSKPGLKMDITDMDADELDAAANFIEQSLSPPHTGPQGESTSELFELAKSCPEINMRNYTERDVEELNNWAVEVALKIEAGQAAKVDQDKPTSPDPLSSEQRISTEYMHPEPTELHRQAASMFFCWPTNAIDLAKNDSDLPELVEKLAQLLAAWERKGGAALQNLSAEPVASVDASKLGCPEDIAEDDPDVVRVARSIAENGFGRPWEDFLPVNASDTDQGDLIEYAKAAILALPPQPVSVGQESKWQSMDTAPKDGTWILATQAGLRSGTDEPFIPDTIRWFNGKWENGWTERSYCAPTHWQPLPLSPMEA